MFSTSSRTRPPTNKSRAAAATPGRARRPFQAVNTDVASYDRKDPFAAADALRKLLATLPLKMGGSQLKMSPEEHRLSMHLLMIVEPFIGLLPSSRGLTRQPTENLDEIVSHIDSKRDLLALALSCKRMHGVIFPRHYEYRVIRCKISNIAVWAHFANNRALASNVRCLEILDERSTKTPCVPSDVLSTDTELESSDDELAMHAKQGRLFISALAKMTRLNVFVWSCNHSLIDNLIFGPASEKLDSKHPTILPSLSSVVVRSFKKGYGQNKTPELNRITDMLHHCPNLEELNIDYNAQPGFSYPNADSFFLYGRWPSLKALNLTHLSCTIDGSDAVSGFLSAHENIEVLHLEVGPRANLTGLALATGILPRLRELKCSKEVARAIMADSSNATSRKKDLYYK